MAMHRFTYSSHACVPFSEAALLHLRLVGESQNDRYSVTGLLVYDGARFAQMIEGPEAGVAYIGDRIRRDSRHQDLVVAHDGPTDQRQFQGWSLRARWRRGTSTADDFVREVKATVAPLSDTRAAAYFIHFVTAAG